MSTVTKHRRVAVVTGASSGIGFETALHLAREGWRVIATGRDPGRSAAAEAALRQASALGEVDMIRVDFSRMSEAARAAREVVALTERIDVLINNAGCMAKEKVITEEGLEENFAGNHLGPFLFTRALLPIIRQTAPGSPTGSVRVINTSSNASEMIPDLPWDDLQILTDYKPGAAYCNAKLANVMVARAIASRHAAEGVIAHAVHPGVVDSNFINSADPHSRASILALEAFPPVEAAQTLIWLATAEEPGRSTGGYYYRLALRAMNPVAEDPDKVERLWRESERLLASVGH